MSSNADGSIRTIWYVDDDPDDHIVFEKALLSIAPHVSLATLTSGDELLRILDNPHVPDLLFMDMYMPLKSGKDCIAQIRGSTRLRRLPIVAFSGSDGPLDITHAYGLGANLYVLKPRSFEGLLGMMKKVLALDWNDPEGVTQNHFRNGDYHPFSQ